LIEEYQQRGFLPEALVNFLCLLGWSPKDDREKMPIAEVISLFDFPGINQSNARFDEQKLAHMNQAYLLELPSGQYLARAKDYFEERNVFTAGWPDENYFRAVIEISQSKVRAIDELPDYTSYFFSDEFPIDDKAREKFFKKGDPAARLRELAANCPTIDFSTDESIEAAINALAGTNGVKPAEYIHAGRLAVSGRNIGPGFYSLLRVLGRDRVTKRIERFLASL
jgi:glutamyl-tRNA synthetase